MTLLHDAQRDVSDEQLLRLKAVACANSSEPATLIRRLNSYARDMGELEAYRFLEPGGKETRLSYAGLQSRAYGLASYLASEGIVPGDAVALVIEPSLEFVVGFFACLIGGHAAVPLPKPRSDAARNRIATVLADTHCAAVLTTPITAKALDGALDNTLILTTSSCNDEGFKGFEPCPDTVAVLQYTSGSTADPKAAMITHGNLSAARDAINSAAELTANDRILSWLPLEHDMGLIGGMLQPFWVGAPSVLMAPESFTARPLRWLQAMTKHAITVTVAPDSAYATCARLASSASQLDLSKVEVAFSGAEPLRPETIDDFCSAFEPFGFQRSAMLPCYGLAEATLLVAGEGREIPPKVLTVDPEMLSTGIAVTCPNDRGRRIVSSGKPVLPNICKIVDPDDRKPCAEAQIGEIWVSGPAKAAGYRGKPEATRQSFGGKLADDPHSYLRTGDRGFLYQGRLYVTGRQETRILRNGRTYDAADLERAAKGAHQSLRVGRVAITQSDQDEHIVALHEVSPGKQDFFQVAARALWTRIVRETGVAIDQIRVVSPGTLLWTTSGKIRRKASLRATENAPSQVLLTWQPPQSDHALLSLIDSLSSVAPTERDIETGLCNWLAAISGEDVEDIDPDLPWSDQAVDSLKAAELVVALEQVVDRPLEADLLFTFPCPSELARHLSSEMA